MQQGVFVVAVAGMDNESGRLVDNEQVVVLIDDVERDVLRRNGEVVRLMIKQNLDDITGFDAVVAGHSTAIHPYIAGIGSRLDAIAAGVGHVLCQVVVYTLLALSGIHLAAPAFP